MFSLLLSFVSSEIKFNKLDYLLPPRTQNSRRNPSIIVTSSGTSCVNWENANPDIIRVTPIEDGRCSKSANIEVICNTDRRRAATVFASEYGMSSKIPLTFYVDTVESLSIRTSTKSLFIDTPPKTFQLVGYDSNNNTFDTVSGLDVRFKEDKKYLKISKFNESESSVSLIGTKVGRGSLKGMIGNMNVEVPVIVSYRIKISPGPVLHVPLGTKIPLNLCAIRETQAGEESCSKNIVYAKQNMYTMRSTDKETVSVDDSLVAVGKKYGKASILLEDKAAENNVAKVDIIVEKIAYVNTKTHYILIGQQPTFEPIFYCAHQRMDIFEKPQPKLISGEWDTVGKHVVTFKYCEFTYTEEVIVCNPYKVPPMIVLPVNYYHRFPIEGGSGDNIYRLSEDGVFIMKRDNMETRMEGEVQVLIQDKNLPELTAETTVIVSKIKSATSEISESEIMINSTVKYFKCKFFARGNLNYSVDIPYTTFSDSKIDKNLRGVEEGLSSLWCTDNLEGFVAPKKKIAVLNDMTVSVDGRAAPSSTIPLTVKGGPIKWSPEQKQSLSIVCPGVNTKVLSDTTFSVSSPFEGKCVATIRNIADEINFKPLTFRAPFELNVSKVFGFTIHVYDEAASTNEQCTTPSANYNFFEEDTVESKKVVKAVYYHNIEIFSVARNSKGQMIKYHDDVKEDVMLNSWKISQTRTEKNGSFYYASKAKQNYEVTVKAKVGETQNTLIKVIKPLNVPSYNMLYVANETAKKVPIKGGSGIFSLVQGDGKFTNRSFTPSETTKGLYKYEIVDVCTDQKPVQLSINLFDIDKLEIEQKGTVMVNSYFTFTVKAYATDGSLITEKLRPFINLLTNEEAVEIEPFKFKILAKNQSTIKLFANVSKVSATKTVKVIQPLKVTPSVITILQTQSASITVSSELENIVFNGYDTEVISLNGNTITALKPGTTKILVSSLEVANMEPFVVTVIVPKPLSLYFVESSPNLVKGGVLGLELFIKTDKGNYEAPTAIWEIPDVFEYQITRYSFALINLTTCSNLDIHVESLGLSLDYQKPVEDKLVLPPSLLLAPLTSYLLETPMKCTFEIVGENKLASVSNKGLVSTHKQTGTAVLRVKSKFQAALIIVNIEIPKKLIVRVVPETNEMNVIPVNEKTQMFSSLDGIRFNSTQTGTVISKFNNNFARITFNNENTHTILVNAYNSAFNVNETVTIMQAPISPTLPTVLLGSYLQMNTTAYKPKWSSSSVSASITRKGLLYAKKTGIAVIDNGRWAKTNVTVVKIDELAIEPVSHTTVRIHPIFDIKGIDFRTVHMPNDLKLECSCPHGTATPITNESGLFCVYNTKRDEFAITATLKSYSSKLHVTTKRTLKAAKSFLVPDGYKVEFSGTKRDATVQIADNRTAIALMTKPQNGISVNLNNGTAAISISEEVCSATKQTLVFKTRNDDLVHIDVVLDKVSTKVIPPKKKTPFMHIILEGCIITALCSIYVILLQFGFL